MDNPAAQQKKILIADDNQDMRQTLRLLMETQGYAVDEVTTSDDVIPRVKGTLPNLVLLDVMMPSRQALDGFDVCRMLKESLGDRCPRVILLTAIGEGLKTDIHKIEQSTGADDFVAKPFENQDLVDSVNRLLGADGTQE